MPRGGKIMAHGASSSSSRSDVTPTITAMLQELHQLVNHIQVLSDCPPFMHDERDFPLLVLLLGGTQSGRAHSSQHW